MYILTKVQHKYFAKEIFDYLLCNLESIGYKEVARIVNYPVQHNVTKNFREFLINISETLNVLGEKISEISIRIKDDVPFIQSLVVNVQKKSCGNGFYKFVGYPHPILKGNLRKKQKLTKIENNKCKMYAKWGLVNQNY